MTDNNESMVDGETLSEALAYARSGEYMQARALIESVLEHDPHHVEALIFKGNVIELEMLGRAQGSALFLSRSAGMKKARVCYEKALLLQPNNLTVLADIGDHWRYMDDQDQALKYYDRVVRLGGLTGDERDVDAFVQAVEEKIRILEARGNLDEAQRLRQRLPSDLKPA